MVGLVAEFTNKLEPVYSTVTMVKAGRVSQVENPWKKINWESNTT